MSSYADPRHLPAGDRRLRAPTRGLPAGGFSNFFLYFTELVYNSIKIPVNEFYVKRHDWSFFVVQL